MGNAKYVVSMDHDAFFYPQNLIKFIQTQNSGFTIGGTEAWTGVLREPSSKWFVPYWEYPFPNYPDFFPGVFYAFSMEAAVSIAAATPNVPFFPFDDVYITGFVANEHLKLPLTRIPNIVNKARGCAEVSRKLCSLRELFVACHMGEQSQPVKFYKDLWRDLRSVVC